MKKIADVIGECFDGNSSIRGCKAIIKWPDIVGEAVAANTQATRVRNGVLFVNTDNPVWAHQLTLMKERTIQQINEVVDVDIVDIRFQPRGITREE